MAVSQGDKGPLEAEKALFGLDRPLVLMVKPGLAQPPPGIGEGLRERDIVVLGVPAAFKEHELSASGSRHSSVAQPVFGIGGMPGGTGVEVEKQICRCATVEWGRVEGTE